MYDYPQYICILLYLSPKYHNHYGLIMVEFDCFDIYSINEISFPQDKPTVYRLKISDKITLSGLYYLKKDTSKIVVLFNGALSGKASARPTFMRWSWAYESDLSFISFDDPIVSCTQLTNLGWYVGTHDLDIQEYINIIIKHLITCNDICPSRVFFYGSSGGGFASIMAAIRLRNSVAIVCNPQTNVFSYYEKFSKKLTDNFFQGVDLSPDGEVFYRFSLQAAISKFNYIPTIIYNQNIQDKFHFENHFIPFQKALFSILSSVKSYPNRLNVNLICDKRGHSSISSKEEFILELEQATRLSANNVYYPPLIDDATSEVLDDNVIWFSVSDKSKDFEVSFKLSSDATLEAEKPAIFMVDAENIEQAILIKNGYSYSKRFKCAFKYIERINDEQETVFTVDKDMRAVRVGFRAWHRLGSLNLKNVKISS